MNGPGKKGEGISEEAMEQMKKMPSEELQKIIAQYFSSQTENPRDIMYQMTAKTKEEAGPYPLYSTEWKSKIEAS